MISLCMICGNEEDKILRCLESAKTAFDELCLVRAVGTLTPDKTLEFAANWCAENGKHFKSGTYKNRIPLPHVDNFGAARNQSFDLAAEPWILWLDCDDYLDEINCRRIREAAETCFEHNALFCSYLVEKNGGVILRERLIRRGYGRWKNAIHETCVIDGSRANCPQIQVFHSDHRPKHESSAERNATILAIELEDAPRHYFYLHSESKACGRTKDALWAGRAALVLLPESSVEERYVVLLNMSELEPDKTDEHLLAAAKIQPHRREAFAYLCQKALIDGRASDAVSYFRLMNSLPVPSPVPWTHQGQWYDRNWARNLLRVRCLRACGQSEQADKEHAEHMKDPEYSENFK